MLIALCSPAPGSGKTTLADHLVADFGFVRVAFAVPIKRMVGELLRVSGYPAQVRDRYISGDLKEEPLGDIGKFTERHVDAMLAALGPVPAEVSVTAKPLREIIGAAFKPGITSRRLQQLIGTEVGRMHWDRDIWVLIARDRWRYLKEQGRSVVVDDMRFPNEHSEVVADGGRPYRIIRPGVAVINSHASEGQLDRIPMPEIFNTGTLSEFFADAERAVFA